MSKQLPVSITHATPDGKISSTIPVVVFCVRATAATTPDSTYPPPNSPSTARTLPILLEFYPVFICIARRYDTISTLLVVSRSFDFYPFLVYAYALLQARDDVYFLLPAGYETFVGSASALHSRWRSWSTVRVTNGELCREMALRPGITVLIATVISNGGEDVRFHIYECLVCEEEKSVYLYIQCSLRSNPTKIQKLWHVDVIICNTRPWPPGLKSQGSYEIEHRSSRVEIHQCVPRRLAFEHRAV